MKPRSVAGLFVVGTVERDLVQLRDPLVELGFRWIAGSSDAGAAVLSELNRRLWSEAGGSDGRCPHVSPLDLPILLSRYVPEARELFDKALGRDRQIAPWAWADPVNCFLAEFWRTALEVEPAVLLVHRDPEHVLSTPGSDSADPGTALTMWSRLNLAALVHCSTWPSVIVRHEDITAQPRRVLSDLTALANACGLGTRVSSDAARRPSITEPETEISAIADPGDLHHHRVLARVLDTLDGAHLDPDPPGNVGALLGEVSTFYDEDYYGASYDKTGIPYSRHEAHWVEFFSALAEAIVTTLAPATVLDAGCATGMLVEALRARGVEAGGIDISEWAIGQVPENLRAFCRVGSITEAFDGQYDLITCFEVLEHLPALLARRAISNMCRHAGAILFSSTPDDFDEPTHLNVQSTAYWVKLFAEEGFFRDFDYDASFVAPHAILLRRRESDVDLIVGYERALSLTTERLTARATEAVHDHDELAARFRSLGNDCDHLQRDVRRLDAALRDLEDRRTEEARASADLIARLRNEQDEVEARLAEREQEIRALVNSRTFRYTAGLRRAYGWARRFGGAKDR